MERRQFTREFKLEAVRLIKERGVSYAQASADLGVHPTQLRNWVKQLADDPQHAFPGRGQMTAAPPLLKLNHSLVSHLKARRMVVSGHPPGSSIAAVHPGCDRTGQSGSSFGQTPAAISSRR